MVLLGLAATLFHCFYTMIHVTEGILRLPSRHKQGTQALMNHCSGGDIRFEVKCCPVYGVGVEELVKRLVKHWWAVKHGWGDDYALCMLCMLCMPQHTQCATHSRSTSPPTTPTPTPHPLVVLCYFRNACATIRYVHVELVKDASQFKLGLHVVGVGSCCASEL